MPKNVMCKNCNNLEGEWCELVVDSPDQDLERDCQYFRERTNADRIRAMTDEELANFFGRYGFCDGIIPKSYCRTRKECSLDCVVNWLQQPVKED